MNVKNKVLLVMRVRREMMVEFGWREDAMNDIREGIIAPYVLAACVASLEDTVLTVQVAEI